MDSKETIDRVREAADLLDVLQHGTIVIEPGGACDRAKALLRQILEATP